MDGAQQTKEKIIVQKPSLEIMQQRLQNSGKADEFKGFFDLALSLDPDFANTTNLDHIARDISNVFIDYYGDKVDSYCSEKFLHLVENGMPIIMRCIVPDIAQDIVDKTIQCQIEHFKEVFGPENIALTLH